MSRDYYLENRSMQPKREIADYVESRGILVPKRYFNLREARDSGKKILARSEHPQDYDGVSDLFHSRSLWCFDYKNYLSLDQVGNNEFYLVEQLRNYGGQSSFFCELMGLNEFKFKKDFSVSYWEELRGFSHKIIADPNVEGRYHMTVMNINGDGEYIVWHEGISQKFGHGGINYPKEIDKGRKDLINFYEKVRNLPRFNSTHCPLIEAISVINENKEVDIYFLQYHKVRDFKDVNFNAEEIAKPDMIKLPLVRGATEEKIETHKVTTFLPGLIKDSPYYDQYVPHQNNFSYLDLSKDVFIEKGHIFLEKMMRETKVVFSVCEKNLDELGESIASDHARGSRQFKPQITCCLTKKDLYQLISEKELVEMEETASKTGEVQTMDVDIVSDGLNAYVKRVG